MATLCRYISQGSVFFTPQVAKPRSGFYTAGGEAAQWILHDPIKIQQRHTLSLQFDILWEL